MAVRHWWILAGFTRCNVSGLPWQALINSGLVSQNLLASHHSHGEVIHWQALGKRLYKHQLMIHGVATPIAVQCPLHKYRLKSEGFAIPRVLSGSNFIAPTGVRHRATYNRLRWWTLRHRFLNDGEGHLLQRASMAFWVAGWWCIVSWLATFALAGFKTFFGVIWEPAFNVTHQSKYRCHHNTQPIARCGVPVNEQTSCEIPSIKQPSP